MRYLNPVEIVVLLIVAVVALALAVPWMLQSRESSRVQQCQRNLQQFASALDAFQKANDGRWPYGTMRGSDLPPGKRLAWTVTLYTAMHPAAKHDFDRSVAWDRDPNRHPVLGGRPVHRNPLFRCPGDAHDSPADRLQWSSYVGMAGIGADAAKLTAVTPEAGFWGYDRQTGLQQITDGTRHTLCILETSRDNGPWTAGGRSTLRGFLPDDQPIFGPGRQFGGHHDGECQVMMADGSVRRLNDATDVGVFRKQCTIAGEPLPKK
ncbi:MAG: DUF1559 domain-containing protein [Planctomycetaceae bacterium]